MKTLSKPQDAKAAEIAFGVEIETMIPLNAGITVGRYHGGLPVTSGRDHASGETVDAPLFRNTGWRADRDASIRCEPGYHACEFVSPILSGDEGLANLRQMLAFIRRIGGQVNASCGLHITVGIKSVIGSADPAATASFVQKLAHVANHNAWAIYAQTGTGRHLTTYAHRLAPEVEQLTRAMKQAEGINGSLLVNQCGRGMVNFRKAFNGDRGAIEFRAFAGTLNEAKVMHHLATAFGLMRRAHLTQTFGRFQKSEKKHKAKTAIEALRRMWRVLGWVDSVPGRDCALGLFGNLYGDFWNYRKAALEMAEKFEQRFPTANL